MIGIRNIAFAVMLVGFVSGCETMDGRYYDSNYQNSTHGFYERDGTEVRFMNPEQIPEPETPVYINRGFN